MDIGIDILIYIDMGNTVNYPYVPHYASEHLFIPLQEAAWMWAKPKSHGGQQNGVLRIVRTAGQGCGFHASSGGSFKWQL